MGINYYEENIYNGKTDQKQVKDSSKIPSGVSDMRPSDSSQSRGGTSPFRSDHAYSKSEHSDVKSVSEKDPVPKVTPPPRVEIDNGKKASDQVAKKPPQEVKQPSSKLNNVKPTSAAPKSEKSTPTTSPHVAPADARSLDEKIADKKEDIAAAEYKVLCEIRQLALNLKKSGRVPCSYCQEQLPKNPLESNGFMYCCDLCRQLDDAEHPSRSESTNCSPKPD